MEIIVRGRLIECIKNKSKDGTKDYYSANIYFEGKMFRIGLPIDKYMELKSQEGNEVEITGVSLWCQGQYSLYIKG